MNLYSFGPILSGIFIFLLAIYIFLKDIRNPIYQLCFLSFLCVAVWLTMYGILYSIPLPPPQILIGYKIAYCWITFIPITFFTYITTFLEIKWTKRWNIFNYIYGIIVIVLILKTDLIISGLYFYSFGPYPKAGALHPLFFFYFTLLLATQIYIQVLFVRNNPKGKRLTQVWYVLVGYIIITLASFDFLPNYKINYYPVGFLFALFFTSTISYAIIKHELMDIKVVIRKSLIYSSLITSLTLLNLAVVLLCESYFRKVFVYQSYQSSFTIALIIAILIMPLRNKIQNIIERILLRNSHDEIIKENEQLREEVIQTDKLKTIATFASGMAHEIKNPLTSIRIFCEYLPQKVHDKEFLNKFIPIVTREANRINELVHDLLDYAKPSPLDLRPNNIHKSMEDVLDALNAQIIDKKIKVIRDFNITITDLNFDNKQIKQALLNILLNAVEASPSNGNILISTQISDNKDAIIVKITDNGYGISKEDLPNIFDPFFTKKEKGTGLGLSITHGIIKEHGGKIFAESSLGQGTTFRIELPIRQS